jgi:hypothetical protein
MWLSKQLKEFQMDHEQLSMVCGQVPMGLFRTAAPCVSKMPSCVGVSASLRRCAQGWL